MMKKHASGPGALFQEQFGRYVIIGPQDSIVFTERGQKKYGPLFARYGKRLQDISSLDAFRRELREVTALEMEANERELAASLRDSRVSDSDKAFIRDMLGLPAALPQQSTAQPASKGAVVIDLAEWRARKQRSPASRVL